VTVVSFADAQAQRGLEGSRVTQVGGPTADLARDATAGQLVFCDDDDAVTITYNEPRCSAVAYGKSTRRIVLDIAQRLGRPLDELMATKTSDPQAWNKAWIKSAAPEDYGHRLVHVAGISADRLNLTLGRRIERFEMTGGRHQYFSVLQSLDASFSQRADAAVEAAQASLPDLTPEPGDDDQ
jgi:hypothetical protein